MKVLLFLSSIILACGSSRPCEDNTGHSPVCTGECSDYYSDSKNITSYEVDYDLITNRGLLVDTSGLPVSSEALDAKLLELEDCLGREILGQCIGVKIAPDNYISECTGTELFPCDFPENRCEEIRSPGETCPCNCAGVIQDGNIVVVTPNLAAFKHELIHVVTGLSDYELAANTEISACEN